MRTAVVPVVVLILLSSAACVAQEAAPADEATPAIERVTTELIALYRFNNVIEGSVVPDVTSDPGGLDLVIQGSAAGPLVQVQENAVHFASPQATQVPGVFSSEPATNLVETIRASGQVTIEAWVTPATDEIGGPARIVTISQDSSSRNITLGQSNDQYILRLRTSATGIQGTPELMSPEGSLRPNQLQHVTVTFDGQTAAMYIDGEPAGTTNHFAGTLDSWDETMSLVLGNEFDGDRRWFGAIHLVAVYGYALSPTQVRMNYEAGL